MDLEVEIAESDRGKLAKLTGELNIYHCGTAKEIFLTLMERNSPIILNLENISAIDTSGVQLLIAMKKDASDKKIPLSFEKHSDSVLRIIDLYGLTGFFADKISLKSGERQKYSFQYGLKSHPEKPI